MHDDRDEEALALFKGLFIAFGLICAAGILVGALIGLIKSMQ